MSYENRIQKAKQAINAADFIIIGGGSGLSSAAGLTYLGKRFTQTFSEFINKYGMTDMYSAGFYPFPSQEEKWAYWSKHILINRYDVPALPLYKDLFKVVSGRQYFVITTNVDYQFYKAGFDAERIFAVQGDYGKLQCSKGCHNTLYDNESLIRQMTTEQQDCYVPSSLIPKCPICGRDMEINIRKDNYFVEDELWNKANNNYNGFIAKTNLKNTVFIELGVGYNTPGIIRFPFEQMTYNNPNATLLRMNADYSEAIPENESKTISFNENLNSIISSLLK